MGRFYKTAKPEMLDFMFQVPEQAIMTAIKGADAQLEGQEAYLTDLQKIIQSKKNGDPNQSYTAQLFFKGLEEIQKKFGEEAIELIIASANKNKNQTIYESADVLFHLLVLLTENNISIEEIIDELKKRSGVSGLEEKSNRKK